jgi:hypothetical protein
VTEKRWAVSTNPVSLLKHLTDSMSNRKRRLLCVACCSCVLHLLVHKQCRKALALAERFADGKATEDDLESEHECSEDVHSLADAAYQNVSTLDEKSNPFTRLSNQERLAALDATEAVYGTVDPCLGDSDSEEVGVIGVVSCVVAANRGKLTKEVALIRDIFGNPFKPVVVERSWLTSDVVALARGIYAKKAFDRMPILADALQDAGCANEDVLSHCRDTSLTHVRGCWVVDLLLGKG